MNNAKVTVTKEVAEAIELSRMDDISVRTMLRHNVHGDFYGVYAPLQSMHVEELAKALLIGYTVEKSPEGKLLEYYDGLVDTATDGRNDAETRELARYEASGVRQTLDILGIKIEGVNA